ncbi:hypothetical protein QUF72_16105 [Desulfobacterales bacterium HSG2]|nr:hypothetical protein [Desulfobacterales bacterium HSG2]
MSLGVSVDVGLTAAISADLVIAQVNSRMPMVLGQSFIHVNDPGKRGVCGPGLMRTVFNTASFSESRQKAGERNH